MICDLLPLQQLHPGERAKIGQLMGSSDSVHRLHELGLREGVQVEMVRRGSPCIIRLSGGKLCFRENVALQILVRRS